jgi:hypothetical protein
MRQRGVLERLSTSIREKTFEEFWEFCCHYQSIHSYPLRFFMTVNDNSKIVVVDSKARDAPLVKEELLDEEDVNHCFVYDLSRNRGGRYLDGNCIESPFSWKLCILNWDSRRFRFRVSERKRLPPFGSGENESWLMFYCIGRIRVISTLLDNATLYKDVEQLHLLSDYNFLS